MHVPTQEAFIPLIISARSANIREISRDFYDPLLAARMIHLTNRYGLYTQVNI